MNAFDSRDIVVVDLGFGDAGKGATVDWLCSPQACLNVAAVVRFNGGAQAAHNVVNGERHHTFSQFGSGTLSGVPTFLSKFMLVEPIALATEARELEAIGVHNPFDLLTIDGRALLTTPIHVAANRAREDTRGGNRHGSCGKGIGETAAYALEHADALTVGDCLRPEVLRRKLAGMVAYYGRLITESRHGFPSINDMTEMYSEFAAAVNIVGPGALQAIGAGGRLIFEGAQGVLLDEWRGFHPHTTWSTVEPSNVRAMIGQMGRESYVLGVTRTYMTRHGAGPFPMEDGALGQALPEPHNGVGEYQGSFRVGHLDEMLLRYAIDVSDGVDGVALTHLDALGRAAAANTPIHGVERYEEWASIPVGEWKDLDHQQALTDALRTVKVAAKQVPSEPEEFVDYLSGALGVPVVLTADGPDRADRRLAATVPA
ncbi:adenylosuccinate synthetase [Rhodococcus sp. IEGM 1379]|uniref:adenylosuccinate synthetase n=1 Tax=Rhodococcus sp. IEGM 1379 TaxID=3047086 RepID=UPI0024B7A4AB|nr:adenylosuccinate synthetase [Rhodococcus sp. IEGM 1379]MDI9916792.1 adenylosuccinate synthetase [Rhodococcus sp. IEGM 1379]